ncbi:MAG: hypothetical protein IJ130_01355 [Solobacterium sp.]|nr:hypothetical protein [Solobacterium sp.]
MENEAMNEQVELNLSEIAQNDPAQAQGESLSAMMTEAAEQPKADDTPPAKEPGWIKGRINKAVEKAVAEAEARVRSEYEQMLAPIRESVLERQAQELVDSGEFKTLAVAKEYLSLKGGMPVKPAEESQPSGQNMDENGRFVSRTEQREDPELNARADILAKQARKIKANRGVDVMEAFNEDPDVKQKVLSGEWDFYDVADAIGNQRTVSAPVRSANGGGIKASSIMSMSDAQFKKLNENLASGRRYDVRK